MRALFDALPTGVVVRNKAGEVVDCNAAASLILGQARERLLDKLALTDATRALRDDLSEYPLAERPTMRTLTTGQGLRGESMGIVGGQGQLRWLIVNTEPQTDAQGRLVKQTDPTGATSDTVYNSIGKVASSTDRYNATTRYFYDRTGVQTCVRYADGAIVLTATYYHPADRERHMIVTDRHFRTSPTQLTTGTRTIYDKVGRPRRVEKLKNVAITESAGNAVATSTNP